MLIHDRDEQEVLEQGLKALKRLLGPDLTVQPYGAQPGLGEDSRTHSSAVMAVKDETAGIYTPLVIEAWRVLTPQDVESLWRSRVQLIRQLMGETAAVLVIAPWLSPRVRERLDHADVGYLDLTGNSHIRIRRPSVLIRTVGASKNPSPSRPPGRGLSGNKAARLVRLLVDVRPPYVATELGAASALSLPYVSRLLEVMTDQALIVRHGRRIVEVDWVGLIRERAAQTNLLKANPAVEMMAPQGWKSVLQRLGSHPELARQAAVTGPRAVEVVSPLTAGGQLMLYVPWTVHAPDEFGRALGLLRSEHSPDVLLLRAGNSVVFQRTRMVGDHVPHVALSQLAIDCLSGTGRMPAEGEAVLDKMISTEYEWRLPNLEALPVDP